MDMSRSSEETAVNEAKDAISACHQNILRSLEDLSIAVVADAEGAHSLRLIGFLRHKLLPHMHSEEDYLYPLIAGFVACSDISAKETMSTDHRFVERQIRSIERWIRMATHYRTFNSEERAGSGELKRLLVELGTVLRVHLRTEENAYSKMLRRYAKDELGSEMRRRVRHVYRDCDANSPLMSRGSSGGM
jgi:iron-sulfur cluster repair protein YtfE (RIC family)